MTRQDYVKIAAVIKARLDAIPQVNQIAREQMRLLAVDMADMLATDNSRFDRARFLAASGF